MTLFPLLAACVAIDSAVAFDGHIKAMFTQGTETNALLYTAGADFLRVEMVGTNLPIPVDIFDLKSGTLILVFPHNRSFVRLKPSDQNPAVATPGLPAMPLPPGIGPQAQGATSGVPAMPAMPPMPMMPRMTEKLELKATSEKKDILGFPCLKYEVKQRGETLEIWATDKLLPYQPYVRNEGSRFGPRMLEEQWPELLTSRKLFPMLAILRIDNGPERFRFEVKSVKPGKLTKEDEKLFQPPPAYFETQPLPR